MTELESEIHKLPKADIHNHLHLGGSRQLLKKKYYKTSPDIPLKYKGLDGMISFIQNDLNKIIDSEEDVIFLMESAIESSIEDNIQYLEASVDMGLARCFNNSIEKLILCVEQLKKKYENRIEFRPDIGINKDCEVDKIYSDGIKCVRSKIFNGIDIYGLEKNRNLDKFTEIFEEAKKENLKTKVHIGEFSNSKTIEEAISLLKPNEIQHGIRAVDSKKTMKKILDNDIQLNVCPQSNIALGAVSSIIEHPIRKLFDYGIRVTVNTDDYLLFNASVTAQLVDLVKNKVFNLDEVKLLVKNGLNI